jgi:gluconolactonase
VQQELIRTALDLELQEGSVVADRVATGLTWSEGPVWFGDGRYLIWSDIPNNRLLRSCRDRPRPAGEVCRGCSGFVPGPRADLEGLGRSHPP